MEVDTPPRFVKREAVTAGIKRSHTEIEDDDEVAEVVPAVKKPKIVIDLSDDSD